MNGKIKAFGIFVGLVWGGAGGWASSASAQTPIQVSVRHSGVESNYQAFAAGANVPINVSAILTQFSNFGASGDFIRVDDSTNSGQAIGQIQVSNANAISSAVTLFVVDSSQVIVPANEADQALNFPTSAAGSSLAGVSVDANSSHRVRLAAVVTDDVTGDVTAGEVFTLRSLSGRIRGNVEATMSESADLSDRIDDAIKFIYAQDGLGVSGTTKSINASGTNGTIKKILIGPKFNGNGQEIAFGIDADIKAEGGLIDNIESSGPIGISRRVDIKGGYGVQFLTCKATENGLTVARNVRANLKANVVATPTNDGNESQHGRIYQVLVSGDLSSDSAIDAWMLRAPTYPGGDPAGTVYGIYVDGAALAPITIERGVLSASILATTFTQPITIGGYIKGRIVATGASGSIPILSIGADTSQSSRGFFGSVNNPDWDLTPCGFAGAGNEPESVVRASAIGSMYAHRVSISGFTAKCFVPRIESPNIDSLFIDEFAGGLVWSGIDDQSPSTGPQRTDTLAHTDIGIAEFGFMDGGAEVFVDDFTRFDILGDCGGIIRAPQLRDNDAIRIGCSLTQGPDHIDLRDNNSLHGYVVIHAALQEDGTSPCPFIPMTNEWTCEGFEETPTPWMGVIRVGNVDQTTEPREFYRNQTIQSGRHAPCYDEDSLSLGGGGMGVLPARFHPRDCATTRTPAPNDTMLTLFQSEFSRVAGSSVDHEAVLLRFYSPTALAWPRTSTACR